MPKSSMSGRQHSYKVCGQSGRGWDVTVGFQIVSCASLPFCSIAQIVLDTVHEFAIRGRSVVVFP